MKKHLIGLAMMLLLFMTGCGTSNQISSSDLDEYEVKNTTDETEDGDFTFRLVTEEEQYDDGDVKLYGEIEYTGDEDEITITHSSLAILFLIEEKAREYEIGYGVDDIEVATTLKQGEPYREEYEKSGGYSPDQDPKDYVSFMEDFLDRDDFPPGYYVVNGAADFSVESEGNSENQEDFKIEAEVNFKVVD